MTKELPPLPPTMATPAQDRQLQLLKNQTNRLSQLLLVEQQARDAQSIRELLMVAVNVTKQIIPYQRGFVWQKAGKKSVRVVAASGVSKLDRHAPIILWHGRVLQTVLRGYTPPKRRGDEVPKEGATNPAVLEGAVLVTQDQLPANLAQEWAAWNCGTGLWIPWLDKQGAIVAGFYFDRHEGWRQEEVELLKRIGATFYYSLNHLQLQKQHRKNPLLTFLGDLSLYKKLALVGAVGLMLLPVRLSVLAPSEVVAKTPFMVNAPIDGVVKEILVQPNQLVEPGTPLFTLDDTTIRNNYEVARQGLEVARAEHSKAAQQAFWDAESKAQLEWLTAQVEKKREEMEYNAELLQRIQVRAQRGGIAIFSNIHDWVGKPVQVGERVMQLADAQDVALKSWISVSDAINLEPGAQVRLFLNVDPIHPLTAHLQRASYEAVLSPEEVLSYLSYADFTPSQSPPRIGLKGTAKVYGQRVTLFYYIFRRPLSYFRQLLGF
ncbi:conserved hypothetical protein [Magnetococcus marinus MC-1]|uniref:Uncharacterized protein n=1 Tax=Magnetococcus marinus (strain ATCC BAA-1437 / JCM 17883 / MC-1) TaxID=156889 RepID=A0L6S2_MAGMM|nr:conserved hypothetical protein [Magnetococcus marinus MC-1]